MKIILEFDSLAEAQEWARMFASVPLSPPPPPSTPPLPEESTSTSEVEVRGLGKRQKEALDVLTHRDGEILSTGEIAAAVGVRSTSMSNILRALSDKGLVTSPSRGKWTLANADPDRVPAVEPPEPSAEPPPVSEVEDTVESEPQVDPQTLLNQKTEDILNGLDL